MTRPIRFAQLVHGSLDHPELGGCPIIRINPISAMQSSVAEYVLVQ
jgi:hypothetical protein